jgi:hypothetical protein
MVNLRSNEHAATHTCKNLDTTAVYSTMDDQKETEMTADSFRCMLRQARESGNVARIRSLFLHLQAETWAVQDLYMLTTFCALVTHAVIANDTDRAEELLSE